MESWTIRQLLQSQEIDGKLYSYQIITILLALENLAGLNNTGIKSYQSWIASRKKRDPFQSTVNLGILARSFEINGFSEEFPLEVDPSDHLLNGGTHRTACSIFYSIDTVPVIFKRRTGQAKDRPKYYGIEYFSETGLFNKQELATLELRWSQVKETHGIIK